MLHRNIQRHHIPHVPALHMHDAKPHQHLTQFRNHRPRLLTLREPPHRHPRKSKRLRKAPHIQSKHRAVIARTIPPQPDLVLHLSLAKLLYHKPMDQNPKTLKRRNTVVRAVIEIGFIIFLFYANLLMGEYTATNDTATKTLLDGLRDIYTYKNFGIAIVCSIIGYVVVEYLRKKS